MACYEDGGAMLLCDVGRLTRSDFLTRRDGGVGGLRVVENGGSMTLSDDGRLRLE